MGDRWKLNKKEINEYKTFLDEKDKKRNETLKITEEFKE